MNGQTDSKHIRKELFTEHVDHNFVPIRAETLPKTTPSYLATIKDVNNVLHTRDERKIKQFLRENCWPVDDEVRKTLWCDVYRLCHPEAQGSIYQEMVNMVFAEGHNQEIHLPSFVDPSYMLHYHLNHHGCNVVKRIICIIGQTNPDVTFSPTMFALTSLLLHLMEEEECFNCLYALLQSRKRTYLTQTKLSYEASALVLKDLAKKYAKSCYTYVTKQAKGDKSVFEHWIWWLVKDLPFSYMVRIMDCYLFEGVKVLYRVALAVLILFNKHAASFLMNLNLSSVDARKFTITEPEADMPSTGCLCTGKSVRQSPQKIPSVNIHTVLSQFCEEIPVSIDKLLKVAFSIRGFSHKEIKKLQIKNEMFLTSKRHMQQVPHLTKSASCDSLDLKVSKSMSGGFELRTIGDQRSSLVSGEQLQAIWQWLPTRMTVYQPEMLYTTHEHGTSLKTLYSRVEDREPTLIVVKTSNGEVFGAYCSADWAERKKIDSLSYFGTGETFVFSLKPERRKFEWVGIGKQSRDVPTNAHMFMAGNNTVLTIGGGDGEAIRLDEELHQGMSSRCATFNNQQLCSEKHFTCTTLEVFGFH
ncbi:GTPase-activating protein skywalker-like isoform X2 [Lineus longissimus]|uniref:GTPase-activating protein skywalker-like isoform X2 n=1 Tax=Lineus longissimus TaxID=88925 RepID=UPI00315DEC71